MSDCSRECMEAIRLAADHTEEEKNHRGPEMSVLLKIIGLVSGDPSQFDGKYVAYYNPHFCIPGQEYNGGRLEVVDAPTRAQQFPDAASALRCWQQMHGLRPDGCPNRPLTSFNVALEPMPREMTRADKIALVRDAIAAVRRARQA